MNNYDKLDLIKFLLDLNENIISLNNVVLDYVAKIYEDIVFEGVTKNES